MKEVRGMTGKLYEIPIKSITYAIKGQKLLERYGMVAYVGRDRTVKSGCGYKLTVKGDLDTAKEILRSGGIIMTGEGRAVE